MKTNVCSICKKEIVPPPNNCGTGFGVTKDAAIVCYSCCGEQDKKQLLETGIFRGYYSKGCFSNWPGSFKVNVYSSKQSYHNFCGRNGRTDFWFTLEGQNFHGVHIGSNNDCATVKRVKK